MCLPLKFNTAYPAYDGLKQLYQATVIRVFKMKPRGLFITNAIFMSMSSLTLG